MLRKIGTSWQFENEALLENFLQHHLEPLLGLKVLGQQHVIHGQICDLIAIAPTGQLAILELKNQEDRYIVQQLTRYFDALITEKPFQAVADYGQPVRLLAIAPSFSRDTFTDCKYSQLTIELLIFRILLSDTAYILELEQLDTQETQTAVIPYQLTQNQRELPPPPKSLLSR